MHVAARIALTLLVIAGIASGCDESAHVVQNPFEPGNGVESGPGSKLWGDTYSGPQGNHVGCIQGRHLAVLITVHNRTNRTVTLRGGDGPQPFVSVIERVAVQVRRAPPPPKGSNFVSGLRPWSPWPSSSVPIPRGRDAWVQLNFLMRNCAVLQSFEPVTVNRSITLSYSADGAEGTQAIAVPAARIILTRGPLHPVLPLNYVG